MRAVVQRVTRAQVMVQGEVTERSAGIVVLVAVGNDDTSPMRLSRRKIVGCESSKMTVEMNLSVADIRGEILVVSHSHLWRRAPRQTPSFDAAAPAQRAASSRVLVERIRATGLVCEPPSRKRCS